MEAKGDDEDDLLRSVALQNANSILVARQRAEQELLRAKEDLEGKTRELADSLAMMGATLESTTDGILVTDTAGKVTGFNERFVKMWRISPETMKRGSHEELLAVISAQVKEPGPFLARVAEISSASPTETQDVIECADGRVLERATRVQVVEERRVGRVWCIRDITERKRAEEQRQVLLERSEAARHEAEAANRAKDEFLAMVSHELRTPLNAITGWSRMLLDGDLGPEKRRHGLEVIDRNARAQAQLIDDLLDVSRIISGKLRLDIGPVDPGRVLELALEAVRPAIDAKEIALQVSLSAIPGTLMGDADRLQQVVWNLLTNAAKFTPKGGRVHVRLGRKDDSLELVVEDTGQGIDADFMPYVFERFHQADAAFTRARGGLGLGLAIVRHLVELHGGTIEARSDGRDRGATFTLRLPMAPAREKAVAGDCSAKAGAAGLPSLEGLRILVVDDEPDGRDMLAVMLERRKAEVFVASSATEALEVLRRTRPMVLLSDVGMPGMDGYELIRRVRALTGEEGGLTLAVALTAYARQEDRTQALLAGFDMHVPKPIDFAELVVVLANLARRRMPQP